MADRIKLDFDRDICRDIVYGDHEDFEVISDNISDTSRWSEFHEVVVKQRSTGNFFASEYSVGATEMQDQCAYEEDSTLFTQVFETQKTVTVYE